MPIDYPRNGQRGYAVAYPLMVCALLALVVVLVVSCAAAPVYDRWCAWRARGAA